MPLCGWAAPLRVNPSACAAKERNYSTANLARATEKPKNLSSHPSKNHPEKRKPLISIGNSIFEVNKYIFLPSKKIYFYLGEAA